MKKMLVEQQALSLFFVAYYGALIANGLLTGKAQTIFYAVFVGAAAWVIARLYGKTRLSSLVLWGLALWGFAHMVGGLVEISGEVIYDRDLGGGELRFDKLVHYFGFGFATLAAYEIIRKGQITDRRSAATTALFIGLGLGAINETVEFLITLLPGDSNVGGFSNTGWDLVANMLGALTASWLAPRLDRPLAQIPG